MKPTAPSRGDSFQGNGPLVTNRDRMLMFKVLLLFGTSWISQPSSFSTAGPWQTSPLLYKNHNSKREKLALLTPKTLYKPSNSSEVDLDDNFSSQKSKIKHCQVVFHAIMFKPSSWDGLEKGRLSESWCSRWCVCLVLARHPQTEAFQTSYQDPRTFVMGELTLKRELYFLFITNLIHKCNK